MKFYNLLKKIEQGGFYIGLLLVGLAFVVINLLPIVMPGKFIDESGSPLLTYGGIALGALAAVFAIYNLKKRMGTSLDEMNYFDKVDASKADPEVIETIRNSDEEQKEYYFHFCGKLNQSYILETPEREPVYEINCDKMGIVNQYIYTFHNRLTGKSFTSKVSHTTTTEYGSETFSLIDQSYFKVDGKNIWDMIAEKGYSLEPYLDKIAFSYHIKRYGIHVADIEAAGTNILKEYAGKGGLRDFAMMQGIYRIYCRESDIDGVALIDFAVSRVEIV